MFVADAGAPLVHLFTSDSGCWQGERDPQESIAVIDPEGFRRGNHSSEEGGPKGLDIAPDGAIMVTSCEEAPLAFFDVRRTVPGGIAGALHHPGLPEAERAREALLRSVSAARHGMEEATDAIRRASAWEVQSMVGSRSWRMTAPLRWINARRTQMALRKRYRRRPKV